MKLLYSNQNRDAADQIDLIHMNISFLQNIEDKNNNI